MQYANINKINNQYMIKGKTNNGKLVVLNAKDFEVELKKIETAIDELEIPSDVLKDEELLKAKEELKRLEEEKIEIERLANLAEEKAKQAEEEILVVENKIKDSQNTIIKLEEDKNKIFNAFIINSTDEEKLEYLEYFDEWEIGVEYKISDVPEYKKYVKRNNLLYRILQPHTSQEDYTPEKTPALFTMIGFPNEVYEFGKNPDGSPRDLTNNGYKYQERCIWDGNIYEWNSETQTGNWSPSDYPLGWTLIGTAK